MKPSGASLHALRRTAFGLLAFWGLFGLMLEAALGWKSALLEDELAHRLFTLGHAHGVGLSMLLLLWTVTGAPHTRHAALASRLLQFGVMAVPVGFVLSAIDHPEGDPNAFVFLVPFGAVAIVIALIVTALSYDGGL